MREIKFRYIYQHHDTGRILNKIFDIHEIELELMGECFIERYTLIARRQYSGLFDKNGLEIYVGDILRLYVLDYDFEPTETYGEVIQLPDGCWYVGGVNDSIYDCIQYQDKHFEVIGNIYENPEL